MHRLEGKYGNCVDFVYLDTDNPQTENVRRDLGSYGQPEFYMLDGANKVIWKKIGYLTADELENQLRLTTHK